MAERAVSSIIQYLAPLLTGEVELLKGVRKEIVSIKVELERIHSFLEDAESRAEKGDKGVKTWLKQVREVSYRIEEVIDEHILLVLPKQRGLVGSLRKVTRMITKLKPRHEIASQIQDIKTTIREIQEGAVRYGFSTSTSSEHSNTSTGSITKDNMWRDPRLTSLFIGDDEVVGIESPKYELISRLVGQNQSQRAVISVVGMGGIGKTTLAKKVYDSQEVVAHFNCKAWITVSQSYKPEELLKKMIKQLSGNDVLPDEGIESFIDKLRGYLSKKRYIIVFDDVWETDFWGSIRHALPKNSDGSWVIITTRNEQVVTFCKETSVDHVHELEALSEEKAWELFCKKAYQLDFEGHCPPELEEVSHAIVRKCQGLPLAIVAIGGLLSTKNKGISEWQKFYGSMHSELDRNPNLTSIKKILLFSYNDLPHYLKSCFLYFGIMPEDYFIRCGRLIRLWIAEGFIEKQNGKTLEEVAEEYLTELIHRRLVQVSTTKFDGRAKSCRVHDVVREIILSLSEEFSLCQILEKENSSFNDTTRRLSMHMRYCNMEKVMESIGKSPVRSIFLFQEGELPKKPLLGTIAANFKLLKVLDLEVASLYQLHEEVGNLFLLRYLSIRRTYVKIIPKSIGKLHNLQTLDLRHSLVRELPFDISRLRKLQHLLAHSLSYECEYWVGFIVGVKMQGGIGCLEELRNLWHVETNHDDGLSLIKELEKLRQLRKLGITKLERGHGRALCAAIEKMKYLQHLSVRASNDDEILDLQYISSSSSPPQYLQHLELGGRLEKLPDWIPKLQNLVRLCLGGSGLTKNDPLKALQVLPSLAHLALWDAYDGEQLYFMVGRFQKLKHLRLIGLKGLNSVIIEEGTLPLLEELTIGPSPQLKEVPSGIHHLRKLKNLDFVGMPEEFIDRMEPKPNQGKDYWIVKHISYVVLCSRIEKRNFISIIGTLQEYFNQKVKKARVREDKNESQS
ncbi:Disease resistance protein RPM1 [Camellia lanceoleosa]|uniref:Disease resistance protein RPM1 n=1 Tax=Camellia lanceoleosa TaxID=1840588 RepID=A0ACC0GR38_9ERIC|nr:Disease resistance protein RPM1 [Camellia lanceoleosa]